MRHSIVWKLDRLGCSLTEAIDTTTGRAMWQMVGILAELERSLNPGTDDSGPCSDGHPWGEGGPQTQAITQQVVHARKLIEQGVRHDTVAQSLNVSWRTLYRALQGY